MLCCIARFCPPVSKTLLLSGFIALLALCGCTKSVHNVSYSQNDVSSMQTLAPEDDTTPLQNKSPDELVATGFAYLASQNLKIADMHFAAAVKKDPTKAEAYVGLGRTQILKGNYNAALFAFNKAKELKPDSLSAIIGATQALRSEGKLDAAVQSINAAMAINPENIYVLRELAMIYDMMGKENLSAPLYQEIVKQSPDISASHNNLGLNYMVRGMYPEAIMAFLQAHELDRDNSRIKNNLASAYLLNGEHQHALNIFKGTVGEAAAYNNIGYLYMTQMRFDEAEEAFKQALRLKPSFYVRAQENMEKLHEMRRVQQTFAQ